MGVNKETQTQIKGFVHPVREDGSEYRVIMLGCGRVVDTKECLDASKDNVMVFPKIPEERLMGWRLSSLRLIPKWTN